ncbi:MAG TPA: ATP-binding cassette domain-containing protein [Candidatus Saccharimonadales bacterium]|nr:ATP-binding cassette domain-containing protein [Candidatus Saccharimonadales bacterium]
MPDIMISAEKVTKRYGSFTAVDNIDFKVKHGEIFAFLGPNGAGKSTTIKMLTTLLAPTSGKLTLAGYDVVKQQYKARKSFGIVFQDPSVDDELTAYENMQLHAVFYKVPRSERSERITTLLKLVELNDRRDHLVRTFSGGMKRRLEIARGLLHHPEVLFLDEPTLGLDTQTRALMWDYVKGLSKDKGTTIFFTTHYIEEAEQVADRIAFIDHGRIVATGTATELREQTKTDSLEQAYLALTGKELRDEEVGRGEARRMRQRAKRMR